MVENGSRYLLHVSDFHLTEEKSQLEYAWSALEALADKLKKEHIKVDYVFHTGDIIDSSDLHEKAASELICCKSFYNSKGTDKAKFNFSAFQLSASYEAKNEFNKKIEELTTVRFKKAFFIMQKFTSRLNVSLGNVAICCGNHDIVRFALTPDINVKCTTSETASPQYEMSEPINAIFEPFEAFLDNLETANSRRRHGQSEPVLHFFIDNLNVLILNTNWINPKDMKPGYYCVNCEQVRKSMQKSSEDMLSIVIAHKPIYEICEKARLSYNRYIKTQFMADLQEFIGENGIYLCGDKHTRSIVGSLFHDIPHYIGGEPLSSKENPSSEIGVEYNLLEISGNKLGMERKIHLTYAEPHKWKCDLRPQDVVVSQLYNLSKGSLIPNVREMIAMPRILNTWENACQEIYRWTPSERHQWYHNLDNLFKSICKCRICGSNDVSWGVGEAKDNIFIYIRKRLENRIAEYKNGRNSNNLLNIRGEYSSGKSTFLGLLYIYLLNEYSLGTIDFIPAYFNLENEDILKRIHSSSFSYHDAAKHVFSTYTTQVQEIANKEHQPICYIIDGLDEQDCWSYSSEDSVGRVLLDILANYNNVYYVMAFSQHRLPCFKNTMPDRTFNDNSDIIYFNPIDVREKGADDQRFKSFITAFLELKLPTRKLNESDIETECQLIRRFRRLTINPGFMYHNFNYITAIDQTSQQFLYKDMSVENTYRYYIDRQYERCLDKLGYGFIHYAPAMAFLFSYRGYTYERFKHLLEDSTLRDSPIIKPICENSDKIYDTFLFIKKDKDAREYLVALHYNRELRYYAEHLTEEISDGSILNEFISRNVAILIRKMWGDSNKFVIVCEKLMQKQFLSNCVQSMLIYCLAHLKMYAPFRNELNKQLFDRGRKTLQEQTPVGMEYNEDDWDIISTDDSEKLKNFIDLSLKHTMQIFGPDNNDKIVYLFIFNRSFCKYNRQHQMLYYGDLSIRGEEKRNPLDPGRDIIYKGLDFHNCFNSLYVKLSSNEKYALREFDMCTLWDLIYSRLSNCESTVKQNSNITPFFYRDAFKEKADKILEQTFTIFDDYLSQRANDVSSLMQRYFRIIRSYLKRILDIRTSSDIGKNAYIEQTKRMSQGFYNTSLWNCIVEADDNEWEEKAEGTILSLSTD